MSQDLPHQGAEPRRARQVRAVARDVHSGQHHLAIAALDQATHLGHDLAHRHRARIPPTVRDDAEGATVIAAVLHLDEGAALALDPVDQVRRRFPHRHDVVDDDLFFPAEAERRRGFEMRARRAPGRAVELLGIAEHAVDLDHAGEGLGLGLGGATGDDDARIGPLALEAPNGLARLAHRFARHRAGIDDHGVVEARRSRVLPNRFQLVGIEATAEGDDVEAHSGLATRPSFPSRGAGWAAPAAANTAGSNRPSDS